MVFGIEEEDNEEENVSLLPYSTISSLIPSIEVHSGWHSEYSEFQNVISKRISTHPFCGTASTNIHRGETPMTCNEIGIALICAKRSGSYMVRSAHEAV